MWVKWVFFEVILTIFYLFTEKYHLKQCFYIVAGCAGAEYILRTNF